MQTGPSPAYEIFVGTLTSPKPPSWWPYKRPDVCVEAAFTLEQSPEGFATLHKRLEATTVPAALTLVVMEATGSYWFPLARLCTFRSDPL